MTHRILSLLVLALALVAVGSAGCTMLDQAFLKAQSEQLELARATYLEAAAEAAGAAKAAGTTDPAKLAALAKAAGEAAVADQLKAGAFDQLLAALKNRGPQAATDAVNGNFVGAGAGGLAILLQLVLAFWQRGRNQQLAAAISAQMAPQAGAILVGRPDLVAGMTPTAAVAPT
jgi:hypothetical protein